uniref:Uncharacterized protein n=1 Tax=Linum usitatissimum TaxID=4006 RepID=A0A172MLF2_LINUS|nr:hypothetical protein [Linum usitatissimum]
MHGPNQYNYQTTPASRFLLYNGGTKPPRTIHLPIPSQAMESVSGTASPPPQIDLSDYSSVVQELQSLRRSYDELQSRHSAVTKQRGELLKRNSDLEISVEETSLERDLLYDLIRQLDVFCKEKQSEIERMMFDEMSTRKGLETEVEISRQRIEQLESEIRDKESQSEFILTSLLNDLREIISHFEDSKSERISVEEADDESRLNSIRRLASEVEAKVDECKKRKKGLEDRIMSLTEENRDLNSLLRAALMEKEAAARNLKELKGNNEQKSFALLQIAERGLQKFGFIIGSSSSEHTVEDSEPSSNEEEIVTLASTVERVTKNLRLEITQLRRSLEDSRSDCERLQSLVDKQAQKIAENALYIQQLEDRERALAQHVEELTEEIKEAEVEAGRWMEACELEVEAGKKEVAERDKVVLILKRELEKTRTALGISNGKLKLKEEVAAAAMAAQKAAEQSLRLADIRATEFRNRMEELSRQLEAIENGNRDRRKVRHRCWPWQSLRDSMNNAGQRRLPEMQALLP